MNEWDVSGMTLRSETQRTRRNMSQHRQWFHHRFHVDWDRTWAFAVRDRRLTVRATARS